MNKHLSILYTCCVVLQARGLESLYHRELNFESEPIGVIIANLTAIYKRGHLTAVGNLTMKKKRCFSLLPVLITVDAAGCGVAY